MIEKQKNKNEIHKEIVSFKTNIAEFMVSFKILTLVTFLLNTVIAINNSD